MKIGGASANGFGIQEILHRRMGKGGIREQQRARGHCLQADPTRGQLLRSRESSGEVSILKFLSD